MHTTIRQRLIFSYSLLLIFLFAIVIVAVLRFEYLAQTMRDVVEGDAARSELASNINLHAESVASRLLLLFLLEKREQRVELYKSIDEKNAFIDQALEKITPLMGEPQERQALQRLIQLRKAYYEHFSATVEALESGERESAINLMTGTTLSDLKALLEETSAMALQQHASMEKRQAQARDVSEMSIRFVIGLGLAALACGLLMAITITRSIVQPLAQAVGAADRIAEGDLRHPVPAGKADEIGSLLASMTNMSSRLHNVIAAILRCSEQVNDAAQQLRKPASKVKTDSAAQSELAVAIDHSVAQFAHGIGSMVNTVQVSHGQALKARNLAQEGARAITVAAKEIGHIANAVAGSAQAVARLDQSTKEVAGAVSQIREIADQTNLLALNASIEAARAGDSGRGFAVVADEVRTLANRTADVTQQIDRVMKLIHEQTHNAVRDIDAGKSGIEHGMSLIQDIVAPLETLQVDAQLSLDSLDTLSSLAASQAQESDAIAANVREIVQMANTNRQATDQLAAITEKLQSTANGLQTSVAAFHL